jgi:hypothetical protein
MCNRSESDADSFSSCPSIAAASEIEANCQITGTDGPTNVRSQPLKITDGCRIGSHELSSPDGSYSPHSLARIPLQVNRDAYIALLVCNGHDSATDADSTVDPYACRPANAYTHGRVKHPRHRSQTQRTRPATK